MLQVWLYSFSGGVPGSYDKVKVLRPGMVVRAASTRRAILDRLSEGESTVTKLAEPFEMSLPAVSKHLTVLEQAGLIVRRKDGRLRRCELAAAPISAAANWIDGYRSFWEDQLDRLEGFLESDSRESDGR